MMKKHEFRFFARPAAALFLLLALFVPALALSAETRASDVKISLITILPGKDLYSAFGHTAFRVVDEKNDYDAFYNYGLSAHDFDLRFALNMLRGDMEFMVGVLRADESIEFYSEVENRGIIEQSLNLDAARKTELLLTLERGALPENRNYNYRYFTDNCTTRPAEILSNLVGDASRLAAKPAAKTTRASVAQSLGSRPWLEFAIDTLLGPVADKPVTKGPIWLPRDLQQWADQASYPVTGGNAALVGATRVIYEAKPAPLPRWNFTPLIAVIILLSLTIVVTILSARIKAPRRVFDAILFSLAIVPGLAILLFWLSAGYQEASGNLNLLWAEPLPLLALIIGRKDPLRPVSLWLFRIAALFAGLVAICGGFGLQSISVELRLVAAAVCLRCAIREGVLPKPLGRLFGFR
jgi:hypothetical protein